MSLPLKTDQKKKVTGRWGENQTPQAQQSSNKGRRAGRRGRQQKAPGLRPMLFLREGGREGGKAWERLPSPKAIKRLHFCREGVKFLRDLESFTQSLHLQKGCAWVFCRRTGSRKVNIYVSGP